MWGILANPTTSFATSKQAREVLSAINIPKSTIESLRPLVEAETGMDFAGSRFTRLCEAVEKVVADNYFSNDLDKLLDESVDRRPFVKQLTTELSIGESFFFRNEHHFQALREKVVPTLIEENADGRSIRVWSAGCSTGEEPHSLAILLDQTLGAQSTEWSVSILGTDINPDFIQRAREAEYRKWSFRRTDIHEDPAYFTKVGNHFRINSRWVRNSMRFAYLNLAKDAYPSQSSGTGGLDLIVFRNVAIYLQADVVAAIVAKFLRCLRPGGWLLLGEAEVAQIQPLGYEVKRIGQATFFQKPYLTPQPAKDPVERDVLTEFSAPLPKSTVENAPPTLEPTGKDAASSFNWESVEQCLVTSDLDLVETNLAGIGDEKVRGLMRFKFVLQLLTLSEHSRATELLDVCLAEHPLMIEGHLLQASMAEERGDLNEAQLSCRRALYVDRGSVMAHFQLAAVLRQLGEAAGARKSLVQVLKLAQNEDEFALVPHGDQLCYGRLCEMAQSALEC